MNFKLNVAHFTFINLQMKNAYWYQSYQNRLFYLYLLSYSRKLRNARLKSLFCKIIFNEILNNNFLFIFFVFGRLLNQNMFFFIITFLKISIQFLVPGHLKYSPGSLLELKISGPLQNYSMRIHILKGLSGDSNTHLCFLR